MAWLALIVLLFQQPDFEPLYRQALAQRELTLGKDDLKTRQSARDLGLYLASRGDYANAALYMEDALRLADTPSDATALHNWAVAVEDRNAANAERLYRKALAVRERALPPTDVELAATRLNLAALVLTRDPGETLKLARSALLAFEKQLGPAHERAGVACGTLGAALAIRGNVVEAERMFRRALAIAEKAHGPTGTQTAAALENLGDLLEQTGRASAARPLLDRAQRIRSRSR
jgi:tetratricopeptide (TPR) repeat protein